MTQAEFMRLNAEVYRSLAGKYQRRADEQPNTAFGVRAAADYAQFASFADDMAKGFEDELKTMEGDGE